MKLFTGTANPLLAAEISAYLNTPLNGLTIEKFSDGEIRPEFTHSIRNEDVYIINSLNHSDDIVETLLIADAAMRADCNSITLVAPYLAYSRQDKSEDKRTSIGSQMLATLLRSVNIDRVITIDLHSSTIQGNYKVLTHLKGKNIFIDYVNNLGLEDLCIVAPDQGGAKRASKFLDHFPNASLANINKKRERANEVSSMELIGNISGKNAIIIDDISDTMGTMKKAAELLINSGAKSVRAIATHAVLSGKALENLESSPITELIVSDSIETVRSKKSDKLSVISCVNLVAEAIKVISEGKSTFDSGLV